MKILFSADWQTTRENLDLCTQAAEEITQLCQREHIGVVVLCGDLKHNYDPVSIFVINFWIRTISKWREMGIKVVVLLGNHDRVGMHVDTQNWFPILRKAGADAWDHPGFLDCGGSIRIGMLPYRKDIGVLKAYARELAGSARRNSDILVFHTDLATAKYNLSSPPQGGDEKLHVEDLHPEKYLHCIGGHIHLQQKLGKNVWYVGSPFATDWGEANQKKGYFVYDSVLRRLERLSSRIPGWFDPAVPEFHAPQTWEGARVRIKVPCSGVAHIQEELNRAEADAKRRYVGADIVVVPALQEEVRAVSKINFEQSDEKKISIYVEETIPKELQANKAYIIKLLTEKLAQAGGLVREGGELKFLAVKGENFLSFRGLKATFAPGLCVVSGENKDWQGRSNGAGKSSFLQPIAVGLFGQTFKNQKHDGWIRRGITRGSKSYVSVWFRDAQGRLCSVKRSRRPKELLLQVNNKPLENGNRMEATQKLIEQISGYTWETLSNAIYVDQHASHLMLTGTEAERKGFLAKLQNLERFERAEKELRFLMADVEGTYKSLEEKVGNLQAERQAMVDTARQAQETFKASVNAPKQYKQAHEAYVLAKETEDRWEREALEKRNALHRQIKELRREREKFTEQFGRVDGELSSLQKQVQELDSLKKTCPTCKQKVSLIHQQSCLEQMHSSSKALQAQREGFRSTVNALRERIEEKDALLAKWLRNQKLAIATSDARDELRRCKADYEQYKKHHEFSQQMRKQLAELDASIVLLNKKKQRVSRQLSMMKYAQSVFQRNGLPAYLNAQLCPQLNQAAVEYAELFTGGEIQVHFAVDAEGRMDVRVINSHGGEEVQDQSEGELKMASLITSFAFRSVAPKTNLLILDEPGDGLDAVSARAFARGLRKVVKRFGTILLTTHSPAILSELSDVNVVKIVKKNGVSELAA